NKLFYDRAKEVSMTERTKNRVRFWYGIFLSVFTLVMGVLFLAQVSDIYFNAEGSPIYSRAIVWQHFFPILIPFCFWIAAVIAGFVLSVVMPCEVKTKFKPSAEVTLAKLKKRIPQGEGEEYLQNYAKVKKYDRVRLSVWCCVAAVCVAGTVYSLIYLLTPSHFATTDFNGAMLTMAKHVLPWVVVGFACCVAAAITEWAMAKRTLPYVKNLIKAGGAPIQKKSNKFLDAVAAVSAQEKWIVLGARIAVAVLGVTFIILGIVNGGAELDVLKKAIDICMECVGIG
ncbi:MAG: hypothetical protein K2L87_06865, partial [Clostridiales bacterium]|nr:hypothetical protein [Clostridiales bacterium]